jgi:hypothetical protein
MSRSDNCKRQVLLRYEPAKQSISGRVSHCALNILINQAYHNATGRLIGILMLCMIPMTINADWKIWNPPGISKGCVLETEDARMSDGYSETKVKLRLMTDSLLIKTNSNVDLSFKDVGLRIDYHDFIAADDIVDEKNVIFRSDLDKIIAQFIKGLRVTLYMRYWPTYPATDNYQTNFSLLGFTKAYNEYLSCKK